MKSYWTLAFTTGEEISPLTPDYINPEKPWAAFGELRLRTARLRDSITAQPAVCIRNSCPAVNVPTRIAFKKKFELPATEKDSPEK